jgi:hypothetical protein
LPRFFLAHISWAIAGVSRGFWLAKIFLEKLFYSEISISTYSVVLYCLYLPAPA